MLRILAIAPALGLCFLTIFANAQGIATAPAEPMLSAENIPSPLANPSEAPLETMIPVAPPAMNFMPFSGMPLYSSLDLMPIPDDQTDIHANNPALTTDLGEGLTFFDDIVFRFAAKGGVNISYDTGIPASENLQPAKIALTGTDEARGSGVFDMTEFSGKFQTDLQAPREFLWAQAFVDVRFTEDDIDDRQIYARIDDLLAGKHESPFGMESTLPGTIVEDGAPAGAVAVREQVQLKYRYYFSPAWTIAPAIARPNNEDFEVLDEDDDVRLRRWPDFIAQLRYQPDQNNIAQAAMLVRQLGFADTDDTERHATGWGISGNVRFQTWGLDNLRAGVVGGEGLGDYLFGLSSDEVAAVPIAGELVALSNFGAYSGYQFVWSDHLASTLAYGFAAVEDRPDLGNHVRTTQNGWINLVWTPSETVALGIEYQCGFREVQDGRTGDNHHLQFSIGATSGTKSVAARIARAEAIRQNRAEVSRAYGIPEPRAMRDGARWNRM